MKKNRWTEFDEQGDTGEPELVRSRFRKRFDEHEDEILRKQKKSSKRFHRKKTIKDGFVDY